jgi:hypothetical protein
MHHNLTFREEKLTCSAGDTSTGRRNKLVFRCSRELEELETLAATFMAARSGRGDL